jgi:hypothetical protein
MATPDKPPTIMVRLNQNIARGNSARKFLATRLAELPAKEIARIPSVFWARLGPRGLAAIAEHFAKTKEITPESNPAQKMEVVPQPRNPWPLWVISTARAAVVIVGALLIGTAERPMWWVLSQSAVINRDDRMTCGRLDVWADHCTYLAKENNLTLELASERLGIDPSALAAINPDLPVNGALPFGVSIRVIRNSWR